MNAGKSNNDQPPFLASLNAVPICRRRMADTDWFPAVDVSEQDQEYLFEFDLPGMKLEEFHISLDGAALQLAGARATGRQGGKSLRAERPFGTFVRRLILPADACADKIQTMFQDGVLALHVHRKLPPIESGKSNIIPFEKAKYEHTLR